MRSLLGSGWPLRGRESASAAFDRIILPSLSRTRVPTCPTKPWRSRIRAHPCHPWSIPPADDESPLRSLRLCARISPTEPEQQNPSPIRAHPCHPWSIPLQPTSPLCAHAFCVASLARESPPQNPSSRTRVLLWLRLCRAVTSVGFPSSSWNATRQECRNMSAYIRSRYLA